MQTLPGIAVSSGVALGEALVIDNEGFRIPRRFVSRDAVDAEIDRLSRAMTAVEEQTARSRETVTRQLGAEYGAIFAAHEQMLRDPKLRGEVEEMIRQRHYSPEYAVSRALRRYAKVFQSLEASFLAERSNDIYDIEKRLLRELLGQEREELKQVTSPVVLLAHNLTPSETAHLDRRFILGFVTEIGGYGSHTAIVAQGMEIPAVVGTGPFLSDVSGGDLVIVDGDRGQVILHPDEETVARYRYEAEEHRSLAKRLESFRELPAQTADGVAIELLGNIEFPHEAKPCRERGAGGVGLYRTEFLYLGRSTEPTEEDHYQAYAQVVAEMEGRPVVIRTLDLGADKMAHLPRPEDESNPCLGLRSIRLSLRNLPLFRTQLRALLRASTLGDVRVMFPMITTLHELRQAKMILADVAEDLHEQGVSFNTNLPVGMMVEVPAAVVLIDRFVEEADFISIGTNDLIQYTLAVDRANKDVATMYTAADPAVLQLIHMTLKAGDRAGKPVSVCGQMSSSITYTMLLLGMGLRRFSVTPGVVPELKRVCGAVTLSQCEAVAERALLMESARDVKMFLRDELRKVAPELAG